MQLSFASGSLWGVPSGSNPTPSRFGVLQNMGVDFTRTTKPLFSLNQFPVAVGAGTTAVKGKATLARLSGRMMNDLFFSGSSAAGQTIHIDNEGPTAIPTTPFQITVVNGATWTTDLGVINAATGIPFTRVASAPTAGQYSVTTGGVYTFASADNVSGISVRISYVYTTTGGQTLTMTNQPMGMTPTFKTVMGMIFNAQKCSIVLNSCVSAKLSLATQLDDFTKPDFEFDAFTDAADTLGTMSFAEVN